MLQNKQTITKQKNSHPPTIKNMQPQSKLLNLCLKKPFKAWYFVYFVMTAHYGLKGQRMALVIFSFKLCSLNKTLSPLCQRLLKHTFDWCVCKKLQKTTSEGHEMSRSESQGDVCSLYLPNTKRCFSLWSSSCKMFWQMLDHKGSIWQCPWKPQPFNWDMERSSSTTLATPGSEVAKRQSVIRPLSRLFSL